MMQAQRADGGRNELSRAEPSRELPPLGRASLPAHPLPRPLCFSTLNRALPSALPVGFVRHDQLDKVHIDKAPTTVSGGIHVGPLKEQADFAPNEVGARSAYGTALEQSRTTTSQLSAPTTTSMVGAKARGGNDITESSHSGEVSVQSSVVMDTTQETNLQVGTQDIQALNRTRTRTGCASN